MHKIINSTPSRIWLFNFVIWPCNWWKNGFVKLSIVGINWIKILILIFDRWSREENSKIVLKKNLNDWFPLLLQIPILPPFQRNRKNVIYIQLKFQRKIPSKQIWYFGSWKKNWNKKDFSFILLFNRFLQLTMQNHNSKRFSILMQFFHPFLFGSRIAWDFERISRMWWRTASFLLSQFLHSRFFSVKILHLILFYKFGILICWFPPLSSKKSVHFALPKKLGNFRIPSKSRWLHFKLPSNLNVMAPIKVICSKNKISQYAK